MINGVVVLYHLPTQLSDQSIFNCNSHSPNHTHIHTALLYIHEHFPTFTNTLTLSVLVNLGKCECCWGQLEVQSLQDGGGRD